MIYFSLYEKLLYYLLSINIWGKGSIVPSNGRVPRRLLEIQLGNDKFCLGSVPKCEPHWDFSINYANKSYLDFVPRCESRSGLQINLANKSYLDFVPRCESRSDSKITRASKPCPDFVPRYESPSGLRINPAS